MALKVLFITNAALSALHQVRPEAGLFIGLRHRGVDVEVVSPADCFWSRRFIAEGIRVHDFIPRRKFSWDAVRRIRAILREGRHDVVHMFNNPAIVNGTLASIGLPVSVVTYRGRVGNIHRHDPVAYFTHLSPRVDCIVCVSHAVAANLGRVVYDPRKLVTIHKGHDLAWYADVQPADLAGFGVPPGRFVVTCVANVRPNKGVQVLIEAARHLAPEGAPEFLLVGSGMTGPVVQQWLAGHPLRERFHLVDYRDDVLGIVAASSITVLASITWDAFPKSVIESMALGVTPVVTDTGGAAELVVDGDSGLIVPPGNAAALARAIVRLQHDPALVRRMGSAARERIGRDFSLDNSVMAHLRLYEQLVDGRRGAPPA